MQPFIVITSPTQIFHEVELVTAMFEHGLQHLHLRKPNWSYNDYYDFLSTIPQCYHSKIVIDNYYTLNKEFQLKGFHFKETVRLQNEDKFIEIRNHKKNNKAFTLSTSFHSKEDIIESYFNYDYVFLSPMFDSVSKKGYKGKWFDVTELPQTIYALGGITIYNFKTALQKGFSSVALLGSIWMDDQPLQQFKEFHRVYNQLQE